MRRLLKKREESEAEAAEAARAARSDLQAALTNRLAQQADMETVLRR
jgi:hypothetical protein